MIQNTDLLHKIIEMQGCIIQGRDIKAILRKDKHFYLSQSKADKIVIYIHEQNSLNIEYVFEENREMLHLLKKYLFNTAKGIDWESFLEHCEKHFKSGNRSFQVTHMYDLFKGFISKKEADAFTAALQMQKAIIAPLYAFDKREKMGYVCYIFKEADAVDHAQLDALSELFETIFRPFYDELYSILYSKCIRVDDHLKLLTHQEKRIVKKVLNGHTYTYIADQLSISINTLKTHMKNIFRKYDVNSKIELFNKLSSHTNDDLKA